MPGANLSLTTFGNGARKGLEVVDVYSKEALDRFLTNPDLESRKSITDLFPGLKPESVEGIVSDPDLKAILDAQGTDIFTFLKGIISDLPVGVDLSLLTDNFLITYIADFARMIKNSLPVQWLKNVGTDIFLYMLEGARAMSDNGIDILGAFSVWQAGESVIDAVTGSFTEASDLFQFATIAYGVSKGETTGLSVFIQEIGTKVFGNGLLTQLLLVAAANGIADAIATLFEETTVPFTAAQKRETIPSLMRGYVLDRRLARAKYWEEATRLVDQLYDLDPRWQLYHRHDKDITSLKNYVYANTDVLTILKHEPRTNKNASIYHERRLRPLQSTYMSAVQYPQLYVR